MVNYQLILCFINTYWYFWGNLTVFCLFHFNIISSFWKWQMDFLGAALGISTCITTLIHVCPLSIWQLGLKFECICWTRERVTNAFPKSTDIIQVLNGLTTDRRHIKVPQDRILYPTHFDKKTKQVIEFCLQVCYWPDLGAHCATPRSLSRECPLTSKYMYRIRIAGLIIVND